MPPRLSSIRGTGWGVDELAVQLYEADVAYLDCKMVQFHSIAHWTDSYVVQSYSECSQCYKCR